MLTTVIKRSDRAALSDLIARKFAAKDWRSDEHRRLWMGAAFACDFVRFERDVRAFSDEGRDTLIALRSIAPRSLSVSQLAFLIATYAEAYPLIEPPRSGWGDNDPYECARFIAGCVTSLGEQLDEASQRELARVVAEGRVGNHIDHARHALAEHARAMAEAA